MTLSDLTDEKALEVHHSLQDGNNIFARRNQDNRYMLLRRIAEKRMYSMFIRKGGKPRRQTPYYMVLGEKELDECKAWFHAYDVIKIPLDAWSDETINRYR